MNKTLKFITDPGIYGKAYPNAVVLAKNKLFFLLFHKKHHNIFINKKKLQKYKMWTGNPIKRKF